MSEMPDFVGGHPVLTIIAIIILSTAFGSIVPIAQAITGRANRRIRRLEQQVHHALAAPLIINGPAQSHEDLTPGPITIQWDTRPVFIPDRDATDARESTPEIPSSPRRPLTGSKHA